MTRTEARTGEEVLPEAGVLLEENVADHAGDGAKPAGAAPLPQALLILLRVRRQAVCYHLHQNTYWYPDPQSAKSLDAYPKHWSVRVTLVSLMKETVQICVNNNKKKSR